MKKRSVRRVLVVVYFLLFGLFYPLLEDKIGILALLLFIILSPASAWGSELLEAYNDDEAHLDERQESLVKDALIVAYAIFAGLLIATGYANQFLADAPVWLLEARDSSIFGHMFEPRVLVLFTVTLPPAVLMWLEPDPIQDEFQAVEAVS